MILKRLISKYAKISFFGVIDKIEVNVTGDYRQTKKRNSETKFNYSALVARIS